MIIFIIGGLVTWRISHMFVKEIGPYAIFARLRAYAASRQRGAGSFYDMISCVACCSVWVGAVASIWAAGDILSWIVYTLSFSAIATLLEHIVYAKK